MVAYNPPELPDNEQKEDAEMERAVKGIPGITCSRIQKQRSLKI
jgi:hypothetical protein